jgi:4-hydroxybenzoate polyprenyltransferase
MTEIVLASPRMGAKLRRYLRLAKPRVVSLIVFCAVIGMLLATPDGVPLPTLFAATLGIALVAGSAAAVNCLIERRIDAIMARTRGRPLPRGEVDAVETAIFSALVGGSGLLLLHAYVNPLTMWLTLATFIGYALIYTVILKPLTPQNIVIGGASGRHAAGAGLGGGHRADAGAGLAAVPHHLPVDAAAFLVAGPVPGQGVRRRQACPCCRWSMAGNTPSAASSPTRWCWPR